MVIIAIAIIILAAIFYGVRWHNKNMRSLQAQENVASEAFAAHVRQASIDVNFGLV